MSHLTRSNKFEKKTWSLVFNQPNIWFFLKKKKNKQSKGKKKIAIASKKKLEPTRVNLPNPRVKLWDRENRIKRKPWSLFLFKTSMLNYEMKKKVKKILISTLDRKHQIWKNHYGHYQQIKYWMMKLKKKSFTQKQWLK
jgi:hypothetical protein